MIQWDLRLNIPKSIKKELSMSTIDDSTKYNVACLACGGVWQPAPGTPLWWKAKQRAAKGYLDAVHVPGEECGCAKKRSQSEAPYRVFGFTDDCREYDIPCTTFVSAVRAFIARKYDTVFISGVSAAVEQRLQYS